MEWVWSGVWVGWCGVWGGVECVWVGWCGVWSVGGWGGVLCGVCVGGVVRM